MEKYKCPICNKIVFSKAYIEMHKKICKPLPSDLPPFESIRCFNAEYSPNINLDSLSVRFSLKNEKRNFTKQFPEKRFKEEHGPFVSERTVLYVNDKLYKIDEDLVKCRLFITIWFDMQDSKEWIIDDSQTSEFFENKILPSGSSMVIFKRSAKKDDQIYLHYTLGFILDCKDQIARPFIEVSSSILIEDFPVIPSGIDMPQNSIPDALKIDFGYRFGESPESIKQKQGPWCSFCLRMPNKSLDKMFIPILLDYDFRDSRQGNLGCDTKKFNLKAREIINSTNFVKKLIARNIPVLRNVVPKNSFDEPIFDGQVKPWIIYLDLCESTSGCVYNTTVYIDEKINVRIDCKEHTGLFKEDNYVDTST